MFIIAFLDKQTERTELTTDFKNLFNTLWALEKSQYVDQYQVRSSYGICEPSNFGWGVICLNG